MENAFLNERKKFLFDSHKILFRICKDELALLFEKVIKISIILGNKKTD